MKFLFNAVFFLAVVLLLLFASSNASAQAAYDTVSIHDLQFVPDPATNDQTPFFGDTVVTRGLVMTEPRALYVGARWAVFIQDPDTPTAPWNGFFIIQHDTSAINTGLQFVLPGDVAYFTGVADEFAQFSQIFLLTNPAVPITIESAGNPLPSPVLLTAQDLSSKATGEQWESLWIRVEDATMVNNNISGDWASFNDPTGSTGYLAEYFNWFRDRLPGQGNGSYTWPSPGTTFNVNGFCQDVNGTPGQVYAVNPRDTFDIQITGDPPPVVTDVSRTPGVPTSSDNVVVFGTITDNGSVQSAILKYSVNEGPFQDASMTNTSGDIYTGTIPSVSDGDFVRYFIYAEDNLGGFITNPGDTSRTSGRVYFYTVRDGGLYISDVQYTHGYDADDQDNSGYEGYEVTLTGVVMTDSTDDPIYHGYWIQEAAARWSGIWLRNPPVTLVKGDSISVTGTVEEPTSSSYQHVTCLVNMTNASVVTPGVGEFSPVDVMTGDVTTGGVDAEAYESVLVRVQNLTVTDPFPDDPGNYGEFKVDDGSGGVRVDDFFGAFRGNLDSTYALNDHIDYLRGFGFYSHGDHKLIPRDSLDVGPVTPGGIEIDKLSIPEDLVLRQNYPNPFNPTTEIEYSIAASGNFSINIYNILGEKVKTLVNARHSIGSYKVQWDGTDDSRQQVGSGIYFYTLKGKNLNLTKKMILLK